MLTTAPLVDWQALESNEKRNGKKRGPSKRNAAEALRAGSVTLAHEFQPMTAVGGDFLDYFQLPDGIIGLYLGDVSVPAVDRFSGGREAEDDMAATVFHDAG